MFRLGLTVSLALLLSAMAQSTNPTTQPIDAAAVAKLVGQLGDDDAGVRSGAHDKLTAMGSAVLPELQKAIESASDPEVRSSLESLIADLAKADKSKPTLVTMKVHGTTARAAIEELTKQTGVEISTWPEDAMKRVRGTVTLDAENQPFWVILNDICEQTALAPMSGHFGANGIVLNNNGEPGRKRPSCYRDGVLFVATEANRVHTLRYGEPKPRGVSDTIFIRALVDPRINVVKAARELSKVEAIDDKGNSLAVSGRDDDRNLESSPWGDTWMWDLNVGLRYRPDQGEKLKTFKGVATFIVSDEAELWEIDLQKFQRSDHAYPGGTYAVEAYTAGANPSVKISITYKEPGMFGRGRNPFESPYIDTNTLRSMLKLVDDKGRTYSSQGLGGGGGGGKLTYETRFDLHRDQAPPGQPVKLIWSIPKAFKQLDVPVEFKDLLIP